MPRIAPIPWEELQPEQRERMQAGQKSGAFTDIMPLRILAYAEHAQAPDDGDRHPNFPRHLLGGKLLELLRIRSAQLGGCAPCSVSRKNEGASEDLVVCMLDTGPNDKLSERERLAVDYLERLANDHHSIDDAVYRRLANCFTTAEIVELGTSCAGMIGMHRFMHTLDLFGDGEPAIDYDPSEIGVTWNERQREAETEQV